MLPTEADLSQPINPMSKLAFQTLGLVIHQPKHRSQAMASMLQKLLAPYESSLTILTNHGKYFPDYTVMSCEALAQTCDMLWVIGGDGSLLATANLAATHQTPLLGIHTGHTGFLTDTISITSQGLKAILHGDYTEETRPLLCLQSDPDKRALNEFVLSRHSPTPRLMTFELCIDGHAMGIHRADGMIIASPSGSTAYALSAGGPIIHPELPAILLCPICPHQSQARPMVVPANSVITLAPHTTDPVHLSADGQSLMTLTQTALHIGQSKETITLVRPHDYRFYPHVVKKLAWTD